MRTSFPEAVSPTVIASTSQVYRNLLPYFGETGQVGDRENLILHYDM
jgi:hypothetical protein